MQLLELISILLYFLEASLNFYDAYTLDLKGLAQMVKARMLLCPLLQFGGLDAK